MIAISIKTSFSQWLGFALAALLFSSGWYYGSHWLGADFTLFQSLVLTIMMAIVFQLANISKMIYTQVNKQVLENMDELLDLHERVQSQYEASSPTRRKGSTSVE